MRRHLGGLSLLAELDLLPQAMADHACHLRHERVLEREDLGGGLLEAGAVEVGTTRGIHQLDVDVESSVLLIHIPADQGSDVQQASNAIRSDRRAFQRLDAAARDDGEVSDFRELVDQSLRETVRNVAEAVLRSAVVEIQHRDLARIDRGDDDPARCRRYRPPTTDATARSGTATRAAIVTRRRVLVGGSSDRAGGAAATDRTRVARGSNLLRVPKCLGEFSFESDRPGLSPGTSERPSPALATRSVEQS